MDTYSIAEGGHDLHLAVAYFGEFSAIISRPIFDEPIIILDPTTLLSRAGFPNVALKSDFLV